MDHPVHLMVYIVDSRSPDSR